VAETCTHLSTIADGVVPASDGCEDCPRTGDRWVHLRVCMTCGYVGCCDSSPNRHATAHWRADPGHPLVRSYEPGEDWWCYADQLVFEVSRVPCAGGSAIRSRWRPPLQSSAIVLLFGAPRSPTS